MLTRTFFDGPNDDSAMVQVYLCSDRTGIIFREEDTPQHTGDVVGVSVSEIDILIEHLRAIKLEIEAGE